MKLTKRFTWPGMKEDTKRYVQSCHECQINKVKFKQPTQQMVLPRHSTTPFEVIHMDFAELRKKSENVKKTRAFLLCVDECTRMVAAKAGKQDTNSVISFLNRKMFENVKVLVTDNGPAFRSHQLNEWAKRRGVTLRFTAPYHPAANGLAERAIRDIKQYLSMYPDFPGGWKCCLEAAVAHHNRSYTTALGCTPLFAATGKPTYLPADTTLGVEAMIRLTEERRTEESEVKYRERMKRNFDKKQNAMDTGIEVGDFVLVKKGLPNLGANHTGPFSVVKTASRQGHLKTIWHIGPNNTIE